MDLAELTATHTDRLAEVDPLLPVPRPLVTGDDAVLLAAEAGGSAAVGEVGYTVHDPGALIATWGALRTHTLLRVRVAGPDRTAALDGLLTLWDSHIARRAEPRDLETAAVVNWPARDTDAVPALVRHGFAPLVATAARPAYRPSSSPTGAGVRIRPAREADLDVVTTLHLAVAEYDAQFGVVTVRPSTADGLRASMAEAMGRERPGLWLAERAEEPVGLLTVDFPPHGDWMARLVAPRPVGYVGCLYVRPEARGSGVGTALVAEAHRELDRLGVAVTLLHHALPNPHSTPFWYAHGYRPLWTLWQRRPAVPVFG